MFANIRNNTIIDFNSQYLDEDILRVETTEEMYQAFLEDRNKVMVVDGEVVINPHYEAEQAQKERERLDSLSMTRGDVFEALILAKGLSKAQLRAMIEAYETDETTKLLYLNRFDEALDFYRGYPIFDLLGEQIGVTPEMWDRFFESKEWEELVKAEKVEIPPIGDIPAEEDYSNAVEGVNEDSSLDDDTTPPDEKEGGENAPSNIEDAEQTSGKNSNSPADNEEVEE